MNVIRRLPLETLEDPDSGNILSTSIPVTSQGIRELLRSQRVRFVLVDVGREPEWIAADRCYEFFKGEVRRQLAREAYGVFLMAPCVRHSLTYRYDSA
jgi:hypothetical protein